MSQMRQVWEAQTSSYEESVDTFIGDVAVDAKRSEGELCRYTAGAH